MAKLPHTDFVGLLNDFNNTLRECRQVYLDGAQLIIDHYPYLLDGEPKEFLSKMDELHKGLLIKLYVSIAGVDRLWNESEEHLANVLFFHVWHRRLNKEDLRESIRHVDGQTRKITWASLVRPFAKIPPLRNSIPELETSIVRIGNLIAKADGSPTSLEIDELKSAQKTIIGYLHKEDDVDEIEPNDKGPYEIQTAEATSDRKYDELEVIDDDDASEEPQVEEKPTLEEAIAELDEMIGLDRVKADVRTLINFLKVEKHRKEMGLPQTDISLHMVFRGNPGTGKTTVARILGDIYAAMGILEKGHLVETDRAGLVAEYAGQTAPKTEKIIDNAIDGVLFIDEAYSLIASEKDDAFGNEAIQKLLKRMEDDRDRLIVILAGYPNEMEELLLSNPGLSSRFTHHIDFPDYTPMELCQIFQLMAEKSHYKFRGLARAKLFVGLTWAYENRDRHFGNGRLVRNIFELAIRRLANRVVTEPKLTRNLLTRFEPQDIRIESVPDEVVSQETLKHFRFGTQCPECKVDIDVGGELLGRRVQCKKCDHKFRIPWCRKLDG